MQQEYDTDQLMERGWQDMQRILDREMPEEKRRRPFLWWTSGIAAALLLSAGIAQYRFQATGDDAATPEQSASANVGGAPATHLPVSPAPPVSTDPPSVRQTPPEPSAAGSTVYIPAPVNELPERTAPDQPAPQTPVAAEHPAPTIALPLILHPLPVHAPSMFSRALPDIRPDAETRLRKPAPGSRPLRLDAYAGVLLAADSRPGMHGGLHLSWQPLRRWGLRAGMGYQYQPEPLRERPVSAISRTQYTEATGNYDIFPISSNTSPDSLNPVLVPVSALHRLEIPIELYWRPHPRWMLSAGAQMRYTFAVNTAEQGLLSGSNLLVNLSDKSIAQLAADDQRGWDTQLISGLSFSVTRRLDLGLSWRWQPPVELPGAFRAMEDFSAPGSGFAAEHLPLEKKSRGQLGLQAVLKF